MNGWKIPTARVSARKMRLDHDKKISETKAERYGRWQRTRYILPSR